MQLLAIGRRLLREGRQFATCGELLLPHEKFSLSGGFPAADDQIARTAGVNKALPYIISAIRKSCIGFVLETMIAQVCVAMNRQKCLRSAHERVCALVTRLLILSCVPGVSRLVQRK